MLKTLTILDKLNLAEKAAKNDIKQHSSQAKFSHDLDKIESVTGAMTSNKNLTAEVSDLIYNRLDLLDNPKTAFNYNQIKQTKVDFHRLTRVLTAVKRSFYFEML